MKSKRLTYTVAALLLTCCFSVITYGWMTDCRNTAGVYVDCEG